MQTFTSSSDLLASNSIGIGKTDHIPAIASLEDNTLSYNGFSVAVSPVWVESYALMSVHTKLKDLPNHKQQELLTAFSENRLALTHKFDAVPTVKTEITGHYLSSDALLSSYFVKVDAITVQDLFNLLLSVKDGMTKEVILSIIQSAKDMIVSPEQLQAVSVLEGKEKGLILGRSALETVGCFNITFASDRQIEASVPFVKADSLPALVAETLKHVPSLDKLGAGCLVMSFDVINQEG
jgi:hypothetical protein